MKRVICLLVVAALFALPGMGLAQDKDKSDSKKSAKEDKPNVQLPAYFGKLGLSDEQKTKVRKAIAESRAKREELQKQIDKLKEEERTTTEGLLTKDQKEKLKELKLGGKDDK